MSASFGGGERCPCLRSRASASFKMWRQANTHAHTYMSKQRLKQNPYAPSSYFPRFTARTWKWKLGAWRGWLEEIKTCLISAATNGDAAHCTFCPLIGLCRSLRLEAHVILTNPPPCPNTNRPILIQGSGPGEGWRSWGMEEVSGVVQEERKEQQKLTPVREAASMLLLIKH